MRSYRGTMRANIARTRSAFVLPAHRSVPPQPLLARQVQPRSPPGLPCRTVSRSGATAPLQITEQFIKGATIQHLARADPAPSSREDAEAEQIEVIRRVGIGIDDQEHSFLHRSPGVHPV